MNKTDERIITLLKGEPTEYQPYHGSITWNATYYDSLDRHLREVAPAEAKEYQERASYYWVKRDALLSVLSDSTYEAFIKSEWYHDSCIDASTTAFQHAQERAREIFESAEYLLRDYLQSKSFEN